MHGLWSGRFWVRDEIPTLLERDLRFIDAFVVSLLPLQFEVGFRKFCGLNELHVVDGDFFGDEVGLFESGLAVVVDEAVDDSELRLAEAQLGPQHD